MRALVTGATGFIGSHLVDRLVTERHEVHVLVRSSSNLAALRSIRAAISVHTINASADNLCALIQSAAPDIVFHLASLFIAEHKRENVPPLIQSNILFPCQLVEAMTRCGFHRLVNCSSSWQHYQNRDYSPVCLYAATKQAFVTLLQFYAEAMGLAVVDLTLFDSYGPCDKRPKLFSTLYRAANNNEMLAFSPGDQLLDMVYVDDVVEAFLIAADRLLNNSPAGLESYGISSGDSISLQDLITLFSTTTGLSPKIAWGRRPYRAREMMVPWQGGKPLPGWRAKVGLEEGIRRVHESHVRHK